MPCIAAMCPARQHVESSRADAWPRRFAHLVRASSGSGALLVHNARRCSRARHYKSRVRTACAPCASSDLFLNFDDLVHVVAGALTCPARRREVRLDREFSSCARPWLSMRRRAEASARAGAQSQLPCRRALASLQACATPPEVTGTSVPTVGGVLVV
ncbi:hypothetical protein FA95DRAFT_1194702 [Auriscalpium vulgare]|uniref:Uncharacterized protein n=1 Tax=Auriscalpium vulgare TaxID=40419 RepID=A0ACB8R3C6_9AGAM|nr:hypothetical protein FA95DRAFT_1194702 [Auriscalpium vulgare]